MTSPLPVLPAITVEAGFSPATPVGAAGVFILGSATQGLLGTDTLGSADTWTDITQWIISFTVTRASTRNQGPLYSWQASTCSVLLDNADGRFDPDNLTGPYVAAGVTQVRPMIPVRISAVFAGVTYRLFTGFADAWAESPVTYEGGYSEVTVTASDGFKMLAGVTLPAQGSPVGAGDSTDGRVNRVLTAAGWYTDHRMLDAGYTTALQGTTEGAPALSLMQLAADTEAGQLYVDGNGIVRFRSRRALMQDTRSVQPQVVFSDTPVAASAVSSVTAQCWGAGGGGGGGNNADADTAGGGGGGEYASQVVTVTPGVTYVIQVGAGGPGGRPGSFQVTGTATAGSTGGVSTFTGDGGVMVTGHGGGGGGSSVTGAAGAAGTGSTNTTHFNGGAGGAGAPTPAVAGGGGGGSGGTSGAGNAGTGGSSGGGGAAAVTGGGPGGQGGTGPTAPPQPPATGPGGGGGGATDSLTATLQPGASGAAGQVTLTWAGGTQTWSVPGGYTWIAGGGQLAYASVSRANDDTQLVNDVQNTAVGSVNLQEVKDSASISTFLFPRSYARTDLPQTTDTEALYWAQFIAYISKNGADRFDVLTVDPLADPANLYPQVLGREIGDRIQVWKTPPGVAQFSKDVFVAGITHAFDATMLTWATSWTLQDATFYSTFLTLGDPVRGQLGSGYVLAF